MQSIRIEVPVGGKTLSFETGLLAKQADGSVLAQLGETVVLSAVTVADKPRPGVDYFPLQVEYREKSYAAGRMPGGYFKREGRPSEKEILIARMTDRPLRPLFPDGFRNDVQINNALLCADLENDADVISMNAASAAVFLSDIPFAGPIGAVRVGRVQGQFIINPTHEEDAQSDVHLVYAGTAELPLMIEGTANEINEEDLQAAMRLAHEAIQPIIAAQHELRSKAGKPPRAPFADVPVDTQLLQKARELAGAELTNILQINPKIERQDRVAALREKLLEQLKAAIPELTDEAFFQVFDDLYIEIVRENVLARGHRIGGRGFEEIRPLEGRVSLLPRTHGSALFQRGETQALATVTLGTGHDVQEMDAYSGGPDEKHFMMHYNFPPYSVGEVGRLGGVGRREIGHGALAERSILPMMPRDYPYTVRVVSEILESNGSSSMASVCAGTLALMDAGVTLHKPVAGISIGLFTAADDRAVLVTDIIGDEDHCGDMDFKVAGTRDGITGFHVDLKLRGLRWEVIEQAFARARSARLQILDFMAGVIAAPRPELSKYAPRITVLQINPEKIGALIGPGGKNIRRITDTLGVQIDVEDDGTVKIFSNDAKSMESAVFEVNQCTAEAEVGRIYDGRVTGVKDFGAFVEILPGLEGLVHISELADFRVRSVEDVVKLGDPIRVKCISVDETGKVRLSRKQALEGSERTSGDAPHVERPSDRPPPLYEEGDAGPRDRDRGPRRRGRR